MGKEELDLWLIEVKGKIIRKEDKKMFDEVAGCFTNGYFRAAYIMAWISIVESLKRKLFDFANMGDTNAIKAVEQIKKYEIDHKSADTLIYKEAGKCGVIEDSDLATMEFFWKERCLFAHPYEKQPNVEQIKFILSEGLRTTLGRRLTYSRDFLKDICINIVEKPFIISNEISDIRKEAKKVLSRTPKKLIPFLFKTLLGKIGELSDGDISTRVFRKLRFFTIEVFLKTEDIDKLGLKMRATKFPFSSIIGYLHSETWDKIPDEIKKILFAYFQEEKDPKKAYPLKVTFSNLIVNGVLGEKYKKRYFLYLDNKLSFNRAIGFYGDSEKEFERIKSEMETHQYTNQGDVVDFLKTEKAKQLILTLSDEQQIQLGRLIESAAANNHYKSKSMSNTIQSGFYATDFAAAGIAVEKILNRENTPRCDWSDFFSAIKILNNLSKESLKKTYIYLNKILSIPKRDIWICRHFESNEFRNLVEKIEENIRWIEGHKTLFEMFVSSLESYSSED